MTPRYLSVKQVRERLNGAVSLRQIYNYVEAGRLHCTRAFGKVLILESSLEALLAEGEGAAPAEGGGAPAGAPPIASKGKGQRPARKSR